ncbi:MAG: DUF1778 domain-containing protein [Acidobacteriota bacterium]
MTGGVRQRNAKLQIRVDKSTKSKIEQAASYANKTLSDFVIENIVPVAERVIDEHTTIKLSARDWDKLMAALENPPEPNAALKKAAQRYKAVLK